MNKHHLLSRSWPFKVTKTPPFLGWLDYDLVVKCVKLWLQWRKQLGLPSIQKFPKSMCSRWCYWIEFQHFKLGWSWPCPGFQSPPVVGHPNPNLHLPLLLRGPHPMYCSIYYTIFHYIIQYMMWYNVTWCNIVWENSIILWYNVMNMIMFNLKWYWNIIVIQYKNIYNDVVSFHDNNKW